MIGIMAVIVIFIMIFSSIIFRKRRNNENMRIIVAVGWLTHLLIRDKYSSDYITWLQIVSGCRIDTNLCNVFSAVKTYMQFSEKVTAKLHFVTNFIT